MKLSFGGSFGLRAAEKGESWCADLSVVAAEHQRPSAAVYLTASECFYIANWLRTMADVSLIRSTPGPVSPEAAQTTERAEPSDA